MPYSLTVNGTPYPLPLQSERNWAEQVNAFFDALSKHLLQKTGGAFTLGAEVDFGTGFGAAIKYIKSKTSANIAQRGFLELDKADLISWRNNANTADIVTGINSADRVVIGTPTAFSAAAGTDIFTSVGRSPLVGEALQCVSFTGTGLTVGGIYYATNVSGQTFKLYGTPGGPAVVDITADGTGVFYILDPALTTGSADTVKNKTFDDTNVITVKDINFTLADDGDTSKRARFDASGVTAGQTRTMSIPDMDMTLLGAASAQVMTNKDIDGGTASNTNRLTVPKGSTAALAALARKQATVLYDSTLLKLFVDNGTSLDPVGAGNGGTGEVSAVLNPSAVNDTSGWTGVSRVTSGSPLDPAVTTAFSVSNAATAESSTSGGYYSIASLPSSLRSRRLKVEFWYTTPATDTYRVSVYQGTTRLTLIQTDVSGATTLPANTSGRFYAEFDATTGASYSVNVTRTSGTTGACVFTNVIFGPGVTGSLMPQITDWQDWSSRTITGITEGNGTVRARYKRNVTDIECYYHLVFGSTSAITGTPTVTVPLSLTIDPQAITTNDWNTIGSATFTDAGAQTYNGAVYISNTGNILVYPTDDKTNAVGTASISATLPFAWGAGDSIEFKFKVPISQWAGSGTSVLNQNTSSPLKAGIIQAFAGSTTPAGWLDCDGSTYSQTLYPQLYAALGSTWATCTNQATGSAYSAPGGGLFRVPDLRNSFLRGSSAAANPAGVTTTLAGFQADSTNRNGLTVTNNAVTSGSMNSNTTHNHTVTDNWTNYPLGTQGIMASPTLAVTFADRINTTSTANIDHTHNVTSNVVLNGGDAETRPDNVGVKFIIKAWDDSFNLAGFAMADLAGNSGLVAAGKMPGLVTGAAIASGYVGQKVDLTGTSVTTVSASTWKVSASAIAQLGPGVWLIYARYYVINNTMSTADAWAAQLSTQNTPGANTISGTYAEVAHAYKSGSANANYHQAVGFVNSSGTTDIWFQGYTEDTTGTVSIQSQSFAIRIA